MASLRKIWNPQVWFTRIAGRVWLRCRGGVTRHQLFPQSAGVSPPPFFNLCPYRQFKSATDYARPMHQSGKMKIGNVKAGSISYLVVLFESLKSKILAKSLALNRSEIFDPRNRATKGFLQRRVFAAGPLVRSLAACSINPPLLPGTP